MKVFLLILNVLFLYGCSPFAVNRDLEGTGHSFACTSGDVTTHSAITWFRTDGKSTISAQYGKTPDLKQSKTLDVDRQHASKLLAGWHRQGVIRRVAHGLYVPIQPSALGQTQVLEDPWVLVPELYEPGYIGGWYARACHKGVICWH